MKKTYFITYIFIFIVKISFTQELEPRSLTNVPTGMNFLVGAYAFSNGNILLDPALPIEDLDANLNTLVGAYVRSINLLGMASKFDVVLPYAFGDWNGSVQGIDTSTQRAGFGDARIRLSVNFIGSPALKAEKFSTYKQKTIVGANIQVIAPTGQYFNEKLINLGSNRWTFKPQLGFSHRMNTWYVESYIGMWIYLSNKQFFPDNKFYQSPLYTIKTHLIKSFKNGMWAALDIGFGQGARTYMNDEKKQNHISGFRFGGTYVVPLAKKHSLKLSVYKSVRLEQGPNFGALAIGYQYRWLK